MSNLMDDVRLAGRRLRRAPAFTAVVVTTLALAFGANAAVFGLVDAVLLRAPLPGAERIVRIWEERLSRGWMRFGVSTPSFRDWQRETRALAHLAAYARRSANLAGSGEPQRVAVLETTAELADVLGVRPRVGRFFLREDEAKGRAPVVVLADEFWRSAFGARADVVGLTVTLDGVPHVVAGVLPAEATAVFEGTQVFRPLSLEGDERRGARWLEVIGRLAPGATRESAAAEMAVIARRHERGHPDTNTGWTTALVALHDARSAGIRPLLLALWAAVSLVLLVACANVAGLMLARASDRDGELAVRAALGAAPGRLARLVMTEGLLLALLGGAAGTLAALGVRAVLARILRDVVELPPAAIDARVFGFVAAATLVASLALALVPVRRARTIALEAALRAGGRGATSPRMRGRRVLAAVELAAAVVLLSGAGLLVRSVRNLLAVSPGFETAGVLVARVAPAQSQPAAGQSEEEFIRFYFAERDRNAVFYDRLLERVSALPGVTAAGAVNRLPLTGRWWTISAAAADRPPVARAETPSAAGRVVTPGYFEALRIPLKEGRVFTRADRAGAAPVAVISETLARQTWPGEGPIGRPLTIDGAVATVVGVVGDVRVEGLDVPAPAIVYVPFAQAQFGLFPDWGLDLVVRASGDLAPLAAVLRAEVARLDPGLPVFAVRTADDVLGGWMARRRAAMVLFGAFAVLAVALAALGLYGVVAQSARQRTREIGVRVALGARPQDIARLVLAEGLGLAAAGAAVGLAAAASGGRLLSSLLFGVTPADPLSLLGTAAALVLVALVAAALPARRASRLDPVAALRHD